MRITYLFFILLFLFACEQENEHAINYRINQYAWRVDTSEMSGTSIRPVFPIVTQVEYVTPSELSPELFDESRVLITLQGKSIFVYP